MFCRTFGIRFGVFIIGILALAGGSACSKNDSDHRMTWFNSHPVAVQLYIEGELVTWSNGNYPGDQSLPPGESKTTWLAYPSGHYEYMVNETPSGNGIVCEGRFDLDADHKNFETIPVAGGSTYEGPGGGFCN